MALKSPENVLFLRLVVHTILLKIFEVQDRYADLNTIISDFKKTKLEPAIIWKLVTCQRITSKNTRPRWVDTWACDTVRWYWSAANLFWQLSIDHNQEVPRKVPLLIILSDGCYAQFPVRVLPPISCMLAGVRLAVIGSDLHRSDETILIFATVC